MRLIPNSTALRSTATASARFVGSPQMPGPVSRIVPKPSRCTGSWPAITKVPLLAAGPDSRLSFIVLTVSPCFSSWAAWRSGAAIVCHLCGSTEINSCAAFGPFRILRSDPQFRVACSFSRQNRSKRWLPAEEGFPQSGILPPWCAGGALEQTHWTGWFSRTPDAVWR